jgi:hypothetical protein
MVNKHTLNSDTTNVIKYVIKNMSITNMNISYYDQCVQKAKTTKLLCQHTNNHLYWKRHIDFNVPKVSTTHFTIRSPLFTQHSLTVITYGKVFWDNVSNSNEILLLQNKVIKITAHDQKSHVNTDLRTYTYHLLPVSTCCL